MLDDVRALVEFAHAGFIAGAAGRLYRTPSAIVICTYMADILISGLYEKNHANLGHDACLCRHVLNWKSREPARHNRRSRSALRIRAAPEMEWQGVGPMLLSAGEDIAEAVSHGRHRTIPLRVAYRAFRPSVGLLGAWHRVRRSTPRGPVEESMGT